MYEPIDRLHEVKAEKLKREWEELKKNYADLCSEISAPVLDIQDDNKRGEIIGLCSRIRSNIIRMNIFIGGRKDD